MLFPGWVEVENSTGSCTGRDSLPLHSFALNCDGDAVSCAQGSWENFVWLVLSRLNPNYIQIHCGRVRMHNHWVVKPNRMSLTSSSTPAHGLAIFH